MYRPTDASSDRTDDEVKKFLADNDITIVRGAEVAPKPALEFDETGFPEEILALLSKQGPYS